LLDLAGGPLAAKRLEHRFGGVLQRSKHARPRSNRSGTRRAPSPCRKCAAAGT
jgi:hypothetical protein